MHTFTVINYNFKNHGQMGLEASSEQSVLESAVSEVQKNRF